jgi:hypothetical protein
LRAICFALREWAMQCQASVHGRGMYTTALPALLLE